MGMYSFFEYESIKVTDSKGLFDWLTEVRKKELYNSFMYDDYFVDIIDGKPFSFRRWDDIKLISYWYDYQVNFLREIAKYLEGSVSWTFENPEEHAYIDFKDGKVTFQLGQMNYKTFEAKDLLSQ